MFRAPATLLTFLLLLLFSCKKYTTENMPPEQLHFGEGGGITGATTEYCLLGNGQVFEKKHFAQPYQPYGTVKKKAIRQFQADLTDLNFDQLKLQEPGDKYYFIQWDRPGKSHKITWGHPDQPVPAAVERLYEELKNLVKNHP